MAGCNEFNLVAHGLGFLSGFDEGMSNGIRRGFSSLFRHLILVCALSFPDLVRPSELYLPTQGIS